VGVQGYWLNSYWGGAIAAAGGALVAGALARLVRDPSRRSTASLGAVGAVVLANSRPFEGAIFCLVALAAFALAVRRARTVTDWSRLAFPAAVILSAGAAWIAFYNWQVTGHPAVMPHALHQREYAASPVLITQADVAIPAYRHESLRRFWEWDRSWYLWARDRPGYSVVSLVLQAMPYLLPLPLVPVFLWGCWKLRPVAAFLGLFLAILCLERWLLPHYLAPATGLVVLLAAVGLRDIGRRPALALVLAAVCVEALTWKPGPLSGYGVRFVKERRAVIDQLSGMPGRHLVIVRYGENHPVSDEWVFNSPDIDGSRVVWAREMTAAEDRKLIDYFRGRSVWLLEADAAPARLISYSPQPRSAIPGSSD
jgi:hypothetical protein